MNTAENHAYYLIHEARYKRILQEIEKISPSHLRILDVGCYPFHLGAALETLGHEVWGISSKHEPMKNKRIAILNIETDPFPYKDNMFDLVLCSEVIEHLPHSPTPALREMYRVTKKGGHMLLTTPNIFGSLHILFRMFGHAPSGEHTTNVYHRHNHEYALRELIGVVQSAGWAITKATRFIGYPPFRARNRQDNPVLWLVKFLNFLLMSLIPPTRDTLLVVGKKET